MTESRLIPWTQTHTVTFFGPDDPITFVPGDLLLFATDGIIAKSIRAGQWLDAHLWDRYALNGAGERVRLADYTWANHAAIGRAARDTDVTADGTSVAPGSRIVSQMSPNLGRAGHEYVPAAGYVHKLCAVVHFDMTDNDRQYLLDADDACAFLAYGFAQYPALVLGGLTGQRVSLVLGAAMICSTEVAHCAANLCLRLDRGEAAVMPQHLAALVDAKPPAHLLARGK